MCTFKKIFFFFRNSKSFIYSTDRDDEEFKEFQTILKSMFTNILIFILCIFLFFNPFLLTNIMFFISIFIMIKTIISFIFPEQSSILNENENEN